MYTEEYLISLWENTNGQETKLFDIGANDMTSANRAFDPILTKNINGTKNFQFSIYHKYIDTITGQEVLNEFIPYLINERIVKVKWQGKWYDFVIKNCIEESESHLFTYECDDLVIQELSKNGYNLEFSSELKDNSKSTGTAAELVGRVLEGTDWIVGDASTIRQELEDACYFVQGTDTKVLQATCIGGPDYNSANTIQDFQLKDYKFLFFYSELQNTDLDTIQAYIVHKDQDFITDLNTLLVSVEQNNLYKLDAKIGRDESDNITITQGATSLTIPVDDNNVPGGYRGNKLVEEEIIEYDPVTEKWVTLCKKGNEKYYELKETQKITPLFVTDLVTNGRNYANLDGWSSNVVANNNEAGVTLHTIQDNASNKLITGTYLKLKNGRFLFNHGLAAAPFLQQNGIKINDKFCVELLVGTTNTETSTGLSKYEFDIYKDGEKLKFFDSENPEIISQEIQDPDFGTQTINIYVFESIQTLLTKDLDSSYTWGIKADRDGDLDLYIKGFMVYPYLEKDEKIIRPGDIVTESYVREVYSYYKKPTSSDEKISFLTFDKRQDKNYIPQKTTNYEKIRSLNVSQSNRFNILQNIAELFECWIDFEIDHNDDGSIKPTEVDQSGKKWGRKVNIYENLTTDTGFSFVYGIDLKGISRNIVSDSIVTKTIVPQNTNEFGTNGFCTIARASNNPYKTNTLYNFDYYIKHNLVNENLLLQDLYHPFTKNSDNKDVISYFPQLQKYATEYDSLTDKLVLQKDALLELESQFKVVDYNLESTATEITRIENDMYNIRYSNGEDLYAGLDKSEWAQEYISLATVLVTKEKDNEALKNKKTDLDSAIDTITKDIATLENQQKTALKNLEALDNALFKKYKHIIQEGVWTSEDYFVDEKYYIDAIKVAATSAFPQLQYSIEVTRVSSLEEFKDKKIELGNIYNIEDVDFFGYQTDGITPYKEKVLVSEIVYHFDHPQDDTITVQNYLTQFEELFSRTQATIQALELNQNRYNAVANIITENGVLKGDVLTAAFANNKNIVMNSGNNDWRQDSTGITLFNTLDSSQVVKLMAGGIFISKDGGSSYTSAITGSGINTSNLLAGKLNVGEINLVQGLGDPTFAWNRDGITAYAFKGNQVVPNTFIRFDQYGLYGVSNYTVGSQVRPFLPNQQQDPLKFIHDNALFGLLWDSFFIRGKQYKEVGNGYIEINSDNRLSVKKYTKIEKQLLNETLESRESIALGETGASVELTSDVVATEEIDKILIGKLDDGTYGIQINDDQGNPIMLQKEEGKMWIDGVLNITTSSAGSVSIGKLGNSNQPEENPVINANNAFVVYEDGSIFANSGKIGTMSISDIEGALSGVAKGYVVQPSTINITTQADRQNITQPIEPSTIAIQLFKNGDTGVEIEPVKVYDSDVEEWIKNYDYEIVDIFNTKNTYFLNTEEAMDEYNKPCYDADQYDWKNQLKQIEFSGLSQPISYLDADYLVPLSVDTNPQELLSHIDLFYYGVLNSIIETKESPETSETQESAEGYMFVVTTELAPYVKKPYVFDVKTLIGYDFNINQYTGNADNSSIYYKLDESTVCFLKDVPMFTYTQLETEVLYAIGADKPHRAPYKIFDTYMEIEIKIEEEEDNNSIESFIINSEIINAIVEKGAKVYVERKSGPTELKKEEIGEVTHQYYGLHMVGLFNHSANIGLESVDVTALSGEETTSTLINTKSNLKTLVDNIVHNKGIVTHFYQRIEDKNSTTTNQTPDLRSDIGKSAIAVIPWTINSITPQINIDFQVNMQNIQAAIGNGKMVFDSEGLTVYNTGFAIKRQNSIDSDDNLLYYDVDNEQLVVKGNITADSGKIGNFSIGENGILEGQSQNGSIILDPTNAKISFTNDIGTVLSLGPNGDNILDIAKKFKITNDGVVEIGSTGTGKLIRINPNDSSIIGLNNNAIPFSISPTEARFNKLVLNELITELSSTQYMGSRMIFRETLECTVEQTIADNDVITYTVTIPNEDGNVDTDAIKGQYIMLSASVTENDFAYIFTKLSETIVKENKVVITTFTDIYHMINTKSPTILNRLTLMGHDKISYFSINSGPDEKTGAWFGSNSLVFNEVQLKDSSAKPNTKLILGDLSVLNNILENTQDYDGYGLYSTNVYLNGDLTTKDGESGFSSDGWVWKEQKPNNVIKENNIILWAGLYTPQDSDKNINTIDSVFKVTKEGNLYAKNANLVDGYFSGTIEAAEIKTATIRGNDKVQSGLDIIGNSAIVFKSITSDNSSPLSVLEINSNGIIFSGGSYFKQEGIDVPNGNFSTIKTEQIINTNNNTVIDLTNTHMRLYKDLLVQNLDTQLEIKAISTNNGNGYDFYIN